MNIYIFTTSFFTLFCISIKKVCNIALLQEPNTNYLNLLIMCTIWPFRITKKIMSKRNYCVIKPGYTIFINTKITNV